MGEANHDMSDPKAHAKPVRTHVTCFLSWGSIFGYIISQPTGEPPASQIGDPCGYIISQPTRWGPPTSQIREAAAGAQTHANVYLRTHPRTRASKLANPDTDEVGGRGCVGAHYNISLFAQQFVLNLVGISYSTTFLFSRRQPWPSAASSFRR